MLSAMLTRPIAYHGQAEGSIGTRWSLPPKKAPQRGSGTARGSSLLTGAPAAASPSATSKTLRHAVSMGRHLLATIARPAPEAPCHRTCPCAAPGNAASIRPGGPQSQAKTAKAPARDATPRSLLSSAQILPGSAPAARNLRIHPGRRRRHPAKTIEVHTHHIAGAAAPGVAGDGGEL